MEDSLSISQRQTIRKLVGKKYRAKLHMKHWRPAFLVDFVTKVLSKAFAEKLNQLYLLVYLQIKNCMREKGASAKVAD